MNDGTIPHGESPSPRHNVEDLSLPLPLGDVHELPLPLGDSTRASAASRPDQGGRGEGRPAAGSAGGTASDTGDGAAGYEGAETAPLPDSSQEAPLGTAPVGAYGQPLPGERPQGEGKAPTSSATEPWQQKAREFARARLWLYGIQTVVSFLFLLVFWYLGWSASMERLLASVASPRWLLVILYLVAYEAISSVLFLPFSYYGGFLLQHRFGLSTQNVAGWFSDWVKSTLIGAAFFVAGMLAFYLALPALSGSWWWILAIALSLVALLLTYVAPVLLLPIFYRRTPLPEGELAGRIRALFEKAGSRVSQIYTIDMSRRTVAANAALTGIGGTRQVLLGDTMLEQFSLDEVETVVAHELGHHVHGDIWKGFAAEIGGIWVGLFILEYLVRPAFHALSLGDISDLANLPLLMLLGGVASLVAMPVSNAVSRHYEAEADAFAARTSQMPRAYSGALYRLAKQNLSELWPPRWVELLFYTHPAIGRRMRAVSGTDGWEGGEGIRGRG